MGVPRAVSHLSAWLSYQTSTDRGVILGRSMGELLQVVARARLGHWVPVAIVVAAAIAAFATAIGFSVYLPVEPD